MATLCAKYGLPANSSVESVERAQLEDHCKRFGIDPNAPDAEQQLEARRDALLVNKAA